MDVTRQILLPFPDHGNSALRSCKAFDCFVVTGAVMEKNKTPVKTEVLSVKCRDGEIRTRDPVSPRHVL